MRTILFFDDQQLQMRTNVQTVQGVPELKPESVYIDPCENVNLSWGYPNVVYEESRGIWLLFYQGWPANGGSHSNILPLMASSADSIRWTPYAPSQPGSRDNWLLDNQYLPLHADGATFLEGQVYRDPYAAPDERYKAITLYKREAFRFEAFLFLSPDGTSWHRKEGVRWHQGEDAPDYPLGIFYNEFRKSYVITGRASHCDRRIALRETRDWEHFSEPELLMQADCLDREVVDLYGMPVVAYRGGYIGFLEVFEPVPYTEHNGDKPSGLATHKFVDGRVLCQLTYSRTGWIFQRFMRAPFISQSDPDRIDFGGVYPCCIVEREEDILIYASATKLEHGRIPPRMGAIVAYRLRKDGFAFLRACAGYAQLRTKALFLSSGEIVYNVRALDGEFRVQYCTEDSEPIPGYTFADCNHFSGDQTDYQPMFAGGKSTGELAGKILVIDLEFRHADLYSISGDFTVLTPYQVGYFKKYGIVLPIHPEL